MFKNKNKTVLDIYNDIDDISKILVEYWDKNFEINWKKLEHIYSR